MNTDFLHSTVFKISILMLSISMLAIISMFSSVFISDNAETDALAVNESGALRMKSYRILAHLLTESPDAEKITVLINDFENSLGSSTFKTQMTISTSGELNTLFTTVHEHWFEKIKPNIANFKKGEGDEVALTNEFSVFVDEIDQLVMGFQSHAETNISTIRLIQSLALFGTILLVAFAMFIVNRNIERPLKKLTDIAKQIGRGNYTEVAEESGKGELAILAKAMNKMSRSIFKSQSMLEERVKSKTAELRKSNNALELLFDVSKSLYQMAPNHYDFDPILKKLADTTSVKDLDLCVMTESGELPFVHLLTTDKSLPDKCINHDCGNCVNLNQPVCAAGAQIKYALSKDGASYGVLVVNTRAGQELEDWQHQLFEAVAEQIATCLSTKEQRAQDRRIALLNERTVIARELHDSLAQALSYLKIQVTRLQKLKDKEDAEAQIDAVIGELKGGLSSAYRELRELLTTFRLKLDNQSLQEAFGKTIEQLKARSDAFEFELNYGVEHIPFTPQEEIHLLQIAREAMQNAFYHSKGSVITVDFIAQDNNIVKLSVRDNGVGIPGDPEKLNHYGLAIMKERARSLRGQLKYVKPEAGGTEVLFTFVPDYSASKPPEQFVNVG